MSRTAVATHSSRGGFMRRLKGLTLVVVAMALVLAAQGAAAGPATVSNVYTVGGLTVPGVNTGLVLTSGMSVNVTATGAVCPFSGFCPGPNGYTLWDTSQSSYGGFPLPGAPAWGLVGRVGNGPWAQVGSGPTTLSGTGVLVFAVNDDLLADNTGSFTVTVSYTCYPGWGYGDAHHTHCGPPGLVGRPGVVDTCYPGYGYGDANHPHCGPPGLVNKPSTSPNPASSPPTGSGTAPDAHPGRSKGA
jgi:hypothetical protein